MLLFSKQAHYFLSLSFVWSQKLGTPVRLSHLNEPPVSMALVTPSCLPQAGVCDQIQPHQRRRNAVIAKN